MKIRRSGSGRGNRKISTIEIYIYYIIFCVLELSTGGMDSSNTYQLLIVAGSLILAFPFFGLKKTLQDKKYVVIGLVVAITHFLIMNIAGGLVSGYKVISIVDIVLVFIINIIISIIATKILAGPNIDPEEIKINTNQSLQSAVDANKTIIVNKTVTINTNKPFNCPSCGTLLNMNSDICPNCHAKIVKENKTTTTTVTTNAPVTSNATKKSDVVSVAFIPDVTTSTNENNTGVTGAEETYVKTTDFNEMFIVPEDQILLNLIEKELAKHSLTLKSSVVTKELKKRKTIFNIMFCFLVFILMILFFFHFPIWVYIIGIIILIIFGVKTNKFKFADYLKKEVKSRPGEKISNIIGSSVLTVTKDNTNLFRILGSVIAVVLSCIVFIKPVILYEEYNDGYAVRFYAFGITNFKTAEIPETHNGKKVLSLRGNTFSNMPLLEEIKLPETITEIRGQFCKNDISLKKINMPASLTYLGGGAFYNCKSLESISFPNTLTEMGGEAFYKASSLKNVKLSENLTEIRGDTFEYCTSLTEIYIPDSVTRIGGHAFYGDTSLSTVTINETSNLTEIGSSAFRQCYSLQNITLPYGIYINERAFKESPTYITYYENDDTYSYEGYNTDYYGG